MKGIPGVPAMVGFRSEPRAETRPETKPLPAPKS
jgi:hypothetical protein